MNTKLKIAAGLLVGLALLLFPGVRQASATLYCGRPYSQLRANPGQPYNAVGLLNNGCTAFLIDSTHIAAAAQCFEDTSTGQWQTGLRFYPNFHPSRVTTDALHVPRADVLRAVVGSRAGYSVLGAGMDWAIARLGPWKDAAGLDLTPLTLASSMPGIGAPLVNPAYTRHHFPYNDNDSVAWDNMQWDSTNCSSAGSNGGMWAVKIKPAPIYDGTHRDTTGCSSRWSAGYIHANCAVADLTNQTVTHNCDTAGGSAGSPLLYKDALGNWKVIGVSSGGGTWLTASSNDFSQLTPTCSDPNNPDNYDNYGPSVERFRLAPRFASSLAVGRSPSSSSITSVFAVDGDANRVVYRTRLGTAFTDGFTYWRSLGTPLQGARLSKVAACAISSTRPQIFVVANGNSIYTRSVNSLGQWGAWSSFPLPTGVSSVADIDAAETAGGCELFMVPHGGSAFWRARTSVGWGSGAKFAQGTFKSVTALQYYDAPWVGLLDTSGQIWGTRQGETGWTAPVMLPRPAAVATWRDLDMALDEQGRGVLYAIPATWNGLTPGPTNSLWMSPLYSTPWAYWYQFDTYLWAPGAAVQNPPSLRTITASDWFEPSSTNWTPVIFGTDDQGNIYLIEYARVGTVGWNVNWKSFYEQYIPYP